MAFEPSSLRTHEAIARTKFLHTGYRKSGKILEDDMLYTLSLFALEPIRFIETYEWRKLTDLEKCAIGTYWKSLGDALAISYEGLPSWGKEGPGGFRDGLHWLEELSAWSQAYEITNMKPSATNKEVADKTTDVLVFTLPRFLEPVGIAFVSFIMDERLRKAMMHVYLLNLIFRRGKTDDIMLGMTHRIKSIARFSPLFFKPGNTFCATSLFRVRFLCAMTYLLQNPMNAVGISSRFGMRFRIMSSPRYGIAGVLHPG